MGKVVRGQSQAESTVIGPSQLKLSESGVTPQVPETGVFKLKALKLSQLYT